MNKFVATVALVFIIAAQGAGIISLASNHWAVNGDFNIGFFQTCTVEIADVMFCSNNLDEPRRDFFTDDKWYMSSVGTLCGGIFFGFVSMVLWFTAICGKKNTSIRASAFVAASLAFVGYICSIIIWKFKWVEDNNDTGELFYDYSEGWSFWIAVGAVCGAGVAVVFMFISLCIRCKKK